MTTVVNNPPQQESPTGGMGMFIGIALVLLMIGLFFVYALPAIQQSSSPQINLPDEVDVNVNIPDQQGQ
jgi:hypothetical protein